MTRLNQTSRCKPSLIHGWFLLFLLVITFSSSESTTISCPLNIETHYPYGYPHLPPVPPAVNYSPTTITPPPPPPRSPRTSKKKIAAAVAGTAATTFAAVGLLFLFWSKYSSRGTSHGSNERPTFPAGVVTPAGSQSEFTRLGGKVKGFIIDEDGLDVIYWRNLKSNSHSRSSKFSAAISSGGGVGGGGQPPPAPLPPEEKKKIPLIPPPPLPPNNRRGERSSFQYNGDMMEAMFGLMATNRKSPIEENPNIKHFEDLHPDAKIFILDPKKSRSTSTVLKSLGVPPSELIESLLKGKGLSVEALEKLVRIVPTRKEESEIMAFDGDPTRLADAESFFYSLLKVVPSAFTCANAMLFMLRYESEIVNIKEPLRTLDSACNELMRCEALLKLLEAILNAGIQLNGGTSTARDVKAFGLSKLLKLSDYKSSDGKTTLLHFVVHKVVRNEGRRCVLTRNNSRLNDPVVKAEKEREFLRLGLPVVGGLSSDFSNVRKAACLDYEACWSSLVSLRTRVDETRQLVAECKFFGGGGFVKEIEGFLELAEGDIKAIQEERTKVMDFVKRATQHYEDADASDGNPLQLFLIVKEFLGMVDQACVEIARSLQQKQPTTAVSRTGSSQPDVLRTRVTFPRLPDHFLSDMSSGSRG